MTREGSVKSAENGLPHVPVVGVIGGGQLARMLYPAANRMGIELRLFATSTQDSAAQVVRDTVLGSDHDISALLTFAAGCDVITFDHEQVPQEILGELSAAGVLLRPGPDALQFAQDKAQMRTTLNALGYPVPQFSLGTSATDVRKYGDDFGWPVIVKAATGGYDGHGVWKINSAEEAEVPFRTGTTADAGVSSRPVVIEEFIDFVAEYSTIVCRSPQDQVVAYPVSESVQDNGICVQTTTPAPNLTSAQAVNMQQLALQIARDLGVVGLLAVEWMQRSNGEPVINELAMRPHNTGHWSIDGANTSQFENHLRAVVDLPLGDPAARNPYVVMANVLGGSITDLPAALLHCYARDRRLRVELYGKTVTPGRKVGHVVTYGDDLDEVRRRAFHAADYLMGKIGHD